MLYISGEGNFRKDIATIKPYKGNRSKDKPHAYEMVKEYLTSGKPHPYTVVDVMEADDALGIAQCYSFTECSAGNKPWVLCKEHDKTVICSNDKDLDMIPGAHYGWSVGERIKEKPMYWVAEDEAELNFFKQLLTGDSADNIPGLFGVGPARAKKALPEDLCTLDRYNVVQAMYEQYFGSYWEMFLQENARLLWILRDPDDDIRNFLNVLECKRLSDLKEEEEF